MEQTIKSTNRLQSYVRFGCPEFNL